MKAFSSGAGFRAGQRRRGFTLIELLVVVALIGILAAVLGFSLSGGSQATALENAQRNLMAMIQAAKANAALEGAPARLIIYADTNAGPGQPDTVNSKALRFYGIIYGNVDPSTGNVTSWTAANEGAYLPAGIYFLPGTTTSFATNMTTTYQNPSSLNSGSSGTGTSPTVPGSHTIGLMQLVDTTGGQGFPAANVTGSDGKGGLNNTYYYIEFEPNGVFSNPNIANLILSAGNLTSDSVVDFGGTASQNRVLSGVQVRFLGTAPFLDPLDIIGSAGQ